MTFFVSTGRRIVLAALVALGLCLGLGGPVFAQPASRAAILPLVADEPLAPHLVAEIHRALRAPLSSRRQITVQEPGQVARRLGPVRGADLTDEAFLKRAGTLLEVEQVAGCRVQTLPGERPGRRRYTYTLVYFDVTGGEMMAQSTGLCPDCTDVELTAALVGQIPSLFAGPYPFGLDTKPSGALVRHGGEEWGRTPIRQILPGGVYTIILEKPGYKTLEVQFPMPDDRPVYAVLPLKEDPDYTPPVVAVAPLPEPAPPARPERGPQVEPTPPARPERGPQVEPTPPARPERGPQVEPTPPARPERGPQVEPTPPAREADTEPVPVIETPEPEPEPAPQPAAVAAQDMSLRRVWAWRTVGLSVALAAGGGAFTAGAVHSGKRADDPRLLPDTRDGYAGRRDAYWIGAYTLYGLSAAAVATSLILFFTEPAQAEGPGLVLAPTLEPGGAGLAAALRY